MHARPPDRSGWYAPARMSRLGMATVLAAHALVVIGLLQMNAMARPTAHTMLSVSLLPATETPEVEQAIVPPQPKPVTHRPAPTQQPNRLATHNETSVPTTTAESPALPAPATSSAPPVLAAAAPSQPRFDADYLDNPKPPYPAIARRLGEQGRVVLRVRVDAGGQALDVQLHTGSGSARLDKSALETVWRWKFVPARLGNESVAATVLVPIAFSLKD